ncbi:alpha/beta hydrolase [Pseudorhodoferax sp.]|uniref:alpha/beta hydrolase n=1 Tax=Pseudorhodoferax sp. TaxID=1993553 RepID=UPI002DD6985F|nr:alpha/beta hydrolase [Pseudorhodoferax sp.]
MRRLGLVLLLGVALAAVLLLGAGELLTRPAARSVGAAPADLGAQTVHIATAPAGVVVGWFARGTPGAGAVLLLHGVRSDRRQMLARARALRAAGPAVLLIDLPAHGESTGERIGFGAREGAGVAAALAFLRRELPGERIGVIGVSLGAASLVLSQPRPAPDAVVLESMYATIGEAVADRLAMRLGPLGPPLAPLLLWQLPLRLGIDPDQLRPVEAIARLGAPVLVVSGREDLHTPWPATQRVFAAAAPPKALWPVEGAAHVDLYAFGAQAYEARVFGFLFAHLRKDGLRRNGNLTAAAGAGRF